MKLASSFSLGLILALSFILFVFFLAHKLGFGDGATILLLFIMTMLFSGTTSALMVKLKETKGRLENATDDKEFKSQTELRKEIEGKSFVPASWSVTDITTDNLLSTKKSISGEL